VKEDLKDLQKAVEGLHNCSARFKESVPVKDDFDGQTTWEGRSSLDAFGLSIIPR